MPRDPSMITGLSFAKSARAHVGNELVRRLRVHEHRVPARVGQVVDVRRPAHSARHGLVRVERGRGLKRVLGELVAHVGRLKPARNECVEQEEMRRRVLREHDRLPAQVAHRLDRLSADDAVAAVRPVDC
jgi:hypothetical protein